MSPKVVFENKDFFVIDKPAGLLVQPTKYQKENTLVDWLIKNYSETKLIGKENRYGIVHRLDKDASGLMVIAKNKKIYYHLINQFKNQKVKKKYLVLVNNCPPTNEGIIDFPIGRTKRGKIVAVKYRKEIKFEKKAKTKYKIKKNFNNYTLLEVEPLTGRTNQIRVHLKAINCPVVGDKKYIKDKSELNRIFLHACYLGFFDLNGKWFEFFSNLPQDLKKFLDKLA